MRKLANSDIPRDVDWSKHCITRYERYFKATVLKGDAPYEFRVYRRDTITGESEGYDYAPGELKAMATVNTANDRKDCWPYVEGFWDMVLREFDALNTRGFYD